MFLKIIYSLGKYFNAWTKRTIKKRDTLPLMQLSYYTHIWGSEIREIADGVEM
jgi:hypothetical protein